jgi:hypothetical protein
VLVVRIANPAPPARRRLGRAKPKDADPATPVAAVPLTTLTAIRPEALGDSAAAAAWLAALKDDAAAIEAEIAEALELVNRAVHAHRTAVLDPGIADVGAEAALAVRIGYGLGDELADGRYAAAIEIPSGERRRRRASALRPTERVAEVLGRRDSVAACELLLLRARGDLDSGRVREAALQLRVGLEALLADRATLTAAGQEADLAALDERREITGEAANEALGGELSGERAEQVEEILGLAERVLRRQRAHG